MTIDDLRRDVRDGARALARRPGFTAVAVLSLAIGIGANTAIFSLVNAIILREPPVEEPSQIVNVYLHQASFAYGSLSYLDYKDLRDGTRDVFREVGAMQYVPAQVDQASELTMVAAEAVTGNYFPMLGVQAAIGRTLLPEDDVARGGHPVVMLDYRYWQQAFGGRSDIVGQTLRISGRSYTVVGVAPRNFAGSLTGLTPAFYAPYMMVEALTGTPMFDARGNHSLFVKARLAHGATLPQVEAATAAIANGLSRDRIQDWDPAARFVVVPIADVVLYPPLDPYIRASAWLLSVVVALVLLLACTNLASFLLARAIDRRRDIAVRLALGASRAALIRRLLVETTMLGVLAAGVGIVLAVWLLRILVRADLPLPLPVTLDLSLDWKVLTFSIAVSAVAGALLGLVPALQSTKTDLVTALKSDSTGGGQPTQARWRSGLVIAQLTVSLVLLVGAGLFLRSFQRIQAVDPGFGRDPTALMTFMIPSTRFTEDEGRVYVRRLLDRYRGLPEVAALGVIDNLPLNTLSTQSIDFNVDGHQPPADHGAFIADRAEIDPGYFDAAGIRLVRGRNFTDADGPDGPPLAIVSEAMAERFWPGGDAVGRLIRRRDGRDPDLLVIGVASDVKVRSIGEPPRNMVYRPVSQQFERFLTVVARTAGDPEQLARTLMAIGRGLDSELWVWETKTMERHLGIVRLPAQLSAFVLSAFAVVALALATIGLYGVVSYAVAQRTREVGVRMALGADAGSVVRLLTASGLRLVAIGSAIGLVAALGVTRLLAGLLFGIDTIDPLTFVAVPLVLATSAGLAAYLPARRASRVDPISALRSE